MVNKVDSFKSPITYSSIVTTPINLYSCFFLVPYRLQWIQDEGIFRATSSGFQKVICGVLYGLFLGTRLWRALHKLKTLQFNEGLQSTTNQLTNPIFTQIGVIPGVYVVPVLITWLSWKCPKYFAALANDLQKIIPKLQFKRLLLTSFLCFIPFINCVVMFNHEVLKSQHSFFNFLLKYWLNDYAPGTSFRHNFLKYSILTLNFIVELVDTLFETYWILILICIYIYTSEFAAQLNRCINIQESRCIMKEMQRFISICNDDLVLGVVTLCIFVEYVLLHSQFAQHLLFSPKDDSIFSQMSNFPFLVMSIFLWIMAADVNRKIHNTVDNWIDMHRDNQFQSVQDQIMVIATGNDFHRRNIGISNGFFVVTYSFLGSLIGLLMTYTLIANQSSSTHLGQTSC